MSRALDAKSAPADLRAEVVALKRQRILEQATDLIFERGYAAATVAAIAEGMNVTKPFVYTYFRNKAEILTAICETGIDESLAALAKGESEADRAIDQLRIAMDAGARAAIRSQKYVVVYQRELKSLEESDALRILRKRRRFDQLVSMVIRRGVEEGDMRVVDPSMTAAWIGGLLSWIAVWYNPAGRRGPDEVTAHFVGAVETLVAGDRR